jgi:hypothetical protein
MLAEVLEPRTQAQTKYLGADATISFVESTGSSKMEDVAVQA